jgi:hypothetical protein
VYSSKAKITVSNIGTAARKRRRQLSKGKLLSLITTLRRSILVNVDNTGLETSSQSVKDLEEKQNGEQMDGE